MTHNRHLRLSIPITTKEQKALTAVFGKPTVGIRVLLDKWMAEQEEEQ